MRLTKKEKDNDYSVIANDIDLVKCGDNAINKLGQLEDIEDELGADLITFLKGVDPNTCFMQITEDKHFYLCGDAYYGDYSKEELLQLIQKLLFIYWELTKEK